jgi:hypothetical protein
VLPADGMYAAVAQGDFGTSRWQLSDQVTLFSAMGGRGAQFPPWPNRLYVQDGDPVAIDPFRPPTL